MVLEDCGHLVIHKIPNSGQDLPFAAIQTPFDRPTSVSLGTCFVVKSIALFVGGVPIPNVLSLEKTTLIQFRLFGSLLEHSECSRTELSDNIE